MEMLHKLDVAYVANRVWIGSVPPIGSVLQRAGFTMVVLCAQELQYPDSLFMGIEVLHCPFDDSETALTASVMQQIADCVLAIDQHLRKCPTNKVLVTCHMGRNRSGLVVADYLSWALGVSGKTAVEMVRRARGRTALSNPAFTEALRALPPHRGQQRAAKAMGRIG